MARIPPPPYYALPKCCPKCSDPKSLKERVNIFTAGIPILGGRARLRLGASWGLCRPRPKVRYLCQKCGFEGLYNDWKETWKECK